MANCDVQFELKFNFNEYRELLEKAEKQIRELKVTIEKVIDLKLTFDLIPVGEELKEEYRYLIAEEREMMAKEVKEEFKKEEEKTVFKCFKCNEELNINNFIAITSREEGHKNLCGDCYVQLSKEKGNATQPEEENT